MAPAVDKSLTLKDAIQAEAERLGFVACGFAHADAAQAAGLDLRSWLAAGHQGTMGWMETRADQRVSPKYLTRSRASMAGLLAFIASVLSAHP